MDCTCILTRKQRSTKVIKNLEGIIAVKDEELQHLRQKLNHQSVEDLMVQNNLQTEPDLFGSNGLKTRAENGAR